MRRIRLSKQEKTVLRLLHNGCGCPDTYPRHVFAACVEALELKGLAWGAWTEGHVLEDAKIAPRGVAYLAQNPALRNPVDWKWVVTTVVAAIAAITGIIALFISCSLLNK